MHDFEAYLKFKVDLEITLIFIIRANQRPHMNVKFSAMLKSEVKTKLKTQIEVQITMEIEVRINDSDLWPSLNQTALA